MPLLKNYLGGYYSQEGTDYCGAISIFNLISFLSCRNTVLQYLYKQSQDTKNKIDRRNALATLYHILNHKNANNMRETVPSSILMKNGLLETLENINHKFIYERNDGKYRQSFTPGKILRFLFHAVINDERFNFFTISSPKGITAHTSASIAPKLRNYSIMVLNNEEGLNLYLNLLTNIESSIKGMMIGTDYHCLSLVIEGFNPPLLINSWKSKSPYQTNEWSTKLGKITSCVILYTGNIDFLNPDLVYHFPKENKTRFNNLLELYQTPRETILKNGYNSTLTLKKNIKTMIKKNNTRGIKSDW